MDTERLDKPLKENNESKDLENFRGVILLVLSFLSAIVIWSLFEDRPAKDSALKKTPEYTFTQKRTVNPRILSVVFTDSSYFVVESNDTIYADSARYYFPSKRSE